MRQLDAPACRDQLRRLTLSGEHLPAPPLVPADHAEQLARALQELADRLRAQSHAAPSLVPDAARLTQGRRRERVGPPLRHEREWAVKVSGRSALANGRSDVEPNQG